MDDADFEIRNLIGLLRRQLRLILITVLVVVGIAALVVYSLTPKFTASALLLVDASQKNLLDPDWQATYAEIDSARVDSEVEIIRSQTILLKVIQDRGLVRDSEFGAKLGLADRVMAFLQIAQPTLPTGEMAVGRVLGNLNSAIAVDRRTRTNLIEISVSSEDPQKAADIANSWATAYIEDQVSAKVDSTLASRDVLQARMSQARDAIVSAEGAFDRFLDDNMQQIIDETGRSDIAGMRTQLSDANASRVAINNRVELVQASLSQRNYLLVAETLQSEALRELDRQRQALATRIASLSDSQAVDLRSELARIEQRLVDAASGELGALRQGVAKAQSEEADLRQRIRTAVLSSSLSPDVLAEIYELQQSSELSRAQYQNLLTRIQDMDAQAAVQIADSRVVSPALPPSRASFPNINLTLALSTLSALGLGVVLAFIRENILGGILTEEQATAVLKVPIAAALPREKAPSQRQDSPGGLADYMIHAGTSPFAEGIRRVKVAIDQVLLRRNLPGETRQALVVLVTSSTASEGKSTTALSLARAYALARARVLLIDCDYRRPSIHKMLGIEPSQDVVKFLSEDRAVTDITSLLQNDPSSELKVLTAIRPDDIPTDQLVTGKTMNSLILHARRTFDVIVLDSPPVGPVVDGLYLSQLADVQIFVIRAETTSQTEARMALGSLKQANPASKTLAVLNQQPRAAASYKSRYYSYYFSETA